ncbi:N-acetyltransferase [Pseudoclavibacter sp. RFBG4]|uniref:GNAT family N-acetyltransferase n=1 Tax=Pseudoclavibacter sp. RFBG4 TaxID=2080575 RepID=UPI000CE90FAD|nr:GNAT family N-acetyltransferase [Pseudoclavibacter sp. RFBG4]PPG26717.1 N-acetyltransferase [Pseudoclavibacter sp. RFBG4]
MTATITLARHDDLDAAADTLAEAFEHYPWTRWVVPERGYSERLQQLQRIYLKYAYHHGFVGVVADLSGVVAVLPPDAPAPGDEVVAQIVALHAERIERISASTSTPDTRAWSLETLGVRPDAQGHGLGGELVRFALQEASRRGARTMRLETSDERNVRLYERCGFRVTRHLDQEHAPMLWSLEARLTTKTAADALHD